jgi:YbbR domain-containing protein
MELPGWLVKLPRPDIRELRPWLRGALTRNLGFKVLSVVFAVGGWVWVQGERVVEQKARVRLDWAIPAELAVVDDLPDSISLTVSGSQVFVRNLRKADLSMQVDLSDASTGAQAVDFEERFIENLPQNVHVVGLSPTRVEFELDEKVTKTVNLEPRTSGVPLQGYRLVSLELDPATIEIEGPARTLVSITEVPTSNIDLSSYRGATREAVLPARLPDNVQRVDNGPIMVSVRLEPISTSTTFEQVPVIVRTPGWTTEVETVRLTLSGPVAAIDSLRLEDATVTVTVKPEVEPGPLQAALVEGPARVGVVLNNSDRIVVDEMEPATIELHPDP